jgi:hypothetical protein
MKPYVESGIRASRRLSPARANGNVAYCRQRLRGFKQVINTLCVCAIIAVPATGVVTQRPHTPAIVALSVLLAIWLLECGERGVKREMQRLRESQP